MGGWRQAVSSELWLFAKREGESPEGRRWETTGSQLLTTAMKGR